MHAGTKVVHLQCCRHKGRAPAVLPAQRSCTCSAAGTKVVHLQCCRHKGRAPAVLSAQRSCTCRAAGTKVVHLQGCRHKGRASAVLPKLFYTVPQLEYLRDHKICISKNSITLLVELGRNPTLWLHCCNLATKILPGVTKWTPLKW